MTFEGHINADGRLCGTVTDVAKGGVMTAIVLKLFGLKQ